MTKGEAHRLQPGGSRVLSKWSDFSLGNLIAVMVLVILHVQRIRFLWAEIWAVVVSWVCVSVELEN